MPSMSSLSNMSAALRICIAKSLVCIWFVGASLAPFVAYTAAPQYDPEFVWVSLINLIATPAEYNSRKVIVSGWLTIEFENMSLCLAAIAPSSKECLWIEINESTDSNRQVEVGETVGAWKTLSGQRVAVQATFDKENTGHLGAWSGALHRIVRITPVERTRK